MKCLGRNAADHCCYIEGRVCEFLEENSEPGFRWSCGLRRELGSWDAVLADARYQPIKAAFAPHGYDCKTFPRAGVDSCGHCMPEKMSAINFPLKITMRASIRRVD